jgi:hypothetical protein
MYLRESGKRLAFQLRVWKGEEKSRQLRVSDVGCVFVDLIGTPVDG